MDHICVGPAHMHIDMLTGQSRTYCHYYVQQLHMYVSLVFVGLTPLMLKV